MCAVRRAFVFHFFSVSEASFGVSLAAAATCVAQAIKTTMRLDWINSAVAYRLQYEE